MRLLIDSRRRSGGATRATWASRFAWLGVSALAFAVLCSPVIFAEEKAEPLPSDVKFLVDNLWVLIAGGLVFIMHLGFATLESGLTRAKNTVNILFKNTMIICIGLLTYGLCGFALMYPGFVDGYRQRSLRICRLGYLPGRRLGKPDQGVRFLHVLHGFLLPGDVRRYRSHHRLWCCGRAYQAGELPGLVDALRRRVLPDRRLVEMGPRLAARSRILRLCRIDPRPLGRWVGRVGHGDSPWGWFGFNGGSVLSADAAKVSQVLVTTSMAAAAGGVSAAMVSWIVGRKPDLSMALNGILAGLVGITAGA